MAIKRPCYELCKRCGEVDAVAVPQGIKVGHRCKKPVPGPQPYPYVYRWDEAYFVRADGSEVFSPPASEEDAQCARGNGMTVREMIEWLKTQDQDATVEVLERIEGRDYFGDKFERRPFHPADYAEYTDMRGNRFAKGQPHEGDRTLFLGAD